MASSSSSSEDSPEENTPTVVSAEDVRNWLELPRDVTASILSRLGSIEILVSAQKVCSLWFNICKDPLMWRTIDMRNDGDLAGPQAIDLEKMCRHAVDRSSGQLFDITLEYFGDDDLIAYIVSR